MRKCEDCKLILDNNTHYCPKCGRSLTDGLDAPAVGTSQRSPRSSATNRRMLFGAAVGILVLIILLTISFARRNHGPKTPASAQVNDSYPSGMLAPRDMRGSDGSSARPQASSGSTRLDGRAAGSQRLRTPAELAIDDQLAQSQGVQTAGVTVDDVIADPRQDTVIVTFSIPATGSITRDSIAAAAGAVARSAFAAHRQVKLVTTRCVVAGSTAQANQIAFVGDMARATDATLGSNPTPEQLLKAFAGTWWNPQIGQSQH